MPTRLPFAPEPCCSEGVYLLILLPFHAGDLAQLQRHAPDARHVVLPGHVLHRADDVEYNAKLVHYFSFLAKRILISRFAM